MDGLTILRWTFSVWFFVCFEAEGTLGCAGTVVQELLFFFPLLFFPFRSLSGFSVEWRWPSRQGAVAAAALALVSWPAASARPYGTAVVGAAATGNAIPALGQRQHTWSRHSGVTPIRFLQAVNPSNCKFLLHTVPEKPTCAVLWARKEHTQILQMSKYLKFKTNEG